MPEYRLFLYHTKELSMKIGRLFFVLFVVIFAVAMVGGCKTPPPPPETITITKEVKVEPPKVEPLTPANLERMQEMKDFAGIDKYQFILVNQIRLNLVKNDRDDKPVDPPPKTNSRLKGAIFTNVSVRNPITFPDRTLGRAIADVTEVGDKYLLRIYFEAPQDEPKYPATSYYLNFTARKTEQTAYFYLEYDDPRPDALNDEKGSLRYGPETYTLMYDERPYLLQRLERKIETKEEPRTVGVRD